jgi:hypothetical protein
MTEFHTPGKFAKWRRAILGGLLSALVLAIALFLLYFYQSPASVIGFYLSITQRIDIGDGGLLSGRPCASPCTFGIRPGETQFDQVIPVLEKNGISKCQTELNVSWNLVICGVDRLNVQTDTHTNTVNAVWFYPNVSISVGQIIEKYGDPNFVSLDRGGLPDAPTIQMNLYWDSIRMLVVMPKVDGKIYGIEKGTKIQAVDFSDETLYQASSEIKFGSFYKLWDGYGTYQP